MEITRWRAEKGDGLDNYVLLSSHLAKKLDAAPASSPGGAGGPEALFEADVVRRVDAHLAAFKATGDEFKLH